MFRGWFALLLAVPLAAQAPVWTRAPAAVVTDAGLQSAGVAGPISAVIPAPDGTLLTGGVGGVWHETSQGWTLLNDGAPVSSLALAGTNLYAGTGTWGGGSGSRAGSGVLVSGDNGASWTTLGGTALGGLVVTAVAVDPAKGLHLLVATAAAADSPAGAAPGVYASSDGGQSWAQVAAGNAWALAWSGGSVLVSTNGGLAFSIDDGATFTRLAGAQAQAAVCAVPSGGFLALFGGASPELMQVSQIGVESTVALDSGFTAGGDGLAVADNGSTIWVGGDGLWSTADGGTQWNDLSMGTSVGIEIGAIAADTAGDVWVGTDEGLWWAPAGGSFAESNSGLSTSAPVATALSGANELLALDGAGIAVGPLDGSGAWTVVDDRVRAAVLAPDAGDGTGDSFFAAVSGSGELLHTSDAGSQWAAVATLQDGADISALADTDGPAGAELWIGDSSGALWSSSDGGLTLTQDAVPSGLTGGIAALSAAGGRLWLAAGNSVWTSADGGASWSALPSLSAAVETLAGDRSNGAVAVVAGGGGGSSVYVLLPGATFWQAMPSGLPGAPVTAMQFDAQTRLWAATLGDGVWSIPLGQAGMSVALNVGSNATAGGAETATATVTSLAGAVAGQTVSLGLSEGGTSVWTSGPLTTGTDGSVAVSVPMPHTAGTATLLATTQSSWGAAHASASIAVQPGTAAQIQVVSGAGVSATNGEVIDLVVEMEDSFGNGVPGAPLNFSGPGSFSPASATTDQQGQVSVAYTLPTTPGTVTLSASDGGIASTWTETALVTPDYSIQLTPPTSPVGPAENLAAVTVQVVPVGGYQKNVSLSCGPNCQLSSTTVAPPYPPVTAAVDLGTRTANETSVGVTVAGDALHSASATIPIQGFSLTLGSAQVTAVAGQTARVGVLVTPSNGFAANVQFTATSADGSPLPSGVAALVDPSAVVVGGQNAVSASLSVTASAGTAFVPASGPEWPERGEILLLVCGAVCAVGAGVGRRRLRLALVAGVAMAAMGCGGGGAALAPAPAPVVTTTIYSLEVTASSSLVSAAAPVTLTVRSQ